MTPELRAHYLDLIAQCEALPDDDEAQALREGLLKSLEPAPYDPIAERTNQLISDYAWALLSEDQDAIRLEARNMRQWLAAVFAGGSNATDTPN